MPRRGNIPKRENAPDAVYGSEMVPKQIKNVMLDGKKSLAEKHKDEALETVREKTGKDPAELLDQAMKYIMPDLEVRPRRVGGATSKVPVEVRPERRVSLGLRWLVRFAQARGEKTMVEKLAGEMMDAANGTGGAVRRREETHRMAEANKAFAHYRW